jgi:hypothetical protein
LATLNGSGQAQFRNFRVSTRAAFPAPAGPTSASYNFASGQFPPRWKAEQSVPRPPTVKPCPAFGEAVGCDGGCAPAVGSNCVQVSHQLNVGGTALFDLPLGIDVTRPWSMSARVAAGDAGFSNAQLVSTMFGGLLDLEGNRAAPLRNAGQPMGFPMELAAWHRAEWVFTPHSPDGGVGDIALSFDGRPAFVTPRPQGWDRHPGRLQLGGAAIFSFNLADFDAWVTDINVSQP